MNEAKQPASLIEAARQDDAHQSFSYHGWVVPEYKCLCMTIPKVACTTVKVTLYYLAGYPVPAQSNDVHGLDVGLFVGKYSTEEIIEILTSPQWVRFCFVRNPYHRLLSANKSKIANRGDTQYWWLRNAIRERFKYPDGNRCRANMVTFADFVHFLSDCGGKVRYELKPDAIFDGHFNAQTRILRQDLIEYDFIGRFENFAADFKTVLTRLGAPVETVALVSERRNVSAHVPLDEVYNPQLAALTYEVYRNDFEAFVYGRDSWLCGS
ncbi:MAG: sulfotransferase family protein [Gemmatimonadota bacterium]|nr:sulfotransferase family protein [Gemmatimonadota bacterium]